MKNLLIVLVSTVMLILFVSSEILSVPASFFVGLSIYLVVIWIEIERDLNKEEELRYGSL